MWNRLRILVTCLLLFAPFMGYRVLRTAGDDKVYTAQIIEMKERGTWILQRLAGEPDYYKGPVHYLLLRVGMEIFGTTMWASVWMNLALLILAAWALARAFERLAPQGLIARVEERRTDWAFFTAMSFVTGIGIYLHAYASQMEIELAAAFAVAIYALTRSEEKRYEFLFWCVAGLVGNVKSPLHSGFIGLAGVLYWVGTGQIVKKFLSPRTWVMGFFAVGLSLSGYAIPYLLDRDHFRNTYLSRETFEKGVSGEPWYSPVWPILTFFLIPWVLPMFVAYVDFFYRLASGPVRRLTGLKRLLGRPGAKALLLWGVFLIPIMAFFVWHPYRAQNYTLPAAPAMALLLGVLWSSATPFFRRLYQGSLFFTALLFFAAASALPALEWKLQAMPEGWPWGLSYVFAAASLWTGLSLMRLSFSSLLHPFKPHRLIYAVLPFYLAFGAVYAALGEREMRDVKTLVRSAGTCKLSKPLELSYYNVQHKLWSEWGYLNFMLAYPVRGLHQEKTVWDALDRGQVILVAEKENAELVRKWAKEKFSTRTLHERPWRRWKTQGKDADGNPLWKAAWSQGDIRLLETDYFMFQLTPSFVPPVFACLKEGA